MLSWLKSKSSNQNLKSREWLNADFIYEDFPIYFRRPSINPAEYRELASQYPVRVTVTHHLKYVESNGLPSPDYNDSLIDFSLYLGEIFQAENSGVTVLIETYAGRRIYYFYVKFGCEREFDFARFQKKHPDEKLDMAVTQDEKWTLIRGYAKQFDF